jgi:hypothetical protein
VSKFKVGDIVHFIGEVTLDLDKFPGKRVLVKWKKKNTLLKIIKVDYDDTVRVVTQSYERWLHCSDIILAVKDNAINRLLYPEYIEENGYLVQKEKYANS